MLSPKSSENMPFSSFIYSLSLSCQAVKDVDRVSKSNGTRKNDQVCTRSLYARHSFRQDSRVTMSRRERPMARTRLLGPWSSFRRNMITLLELNRISRKTF